MERWPSPQVRSCLDLSCGLDVYIVPKPGFCRKHALLAVGFGSLDLRFATGREQTLLQMPDGVAHFLEHRLFERPTGDVSEDFAALGAEVNAHTTFTTTEFFFTTSQHFDACLELLLEFVLSPHLTDAGIAREREIIAREIQLYSDDLEWVGFFNSLAKLYPGHPLGRDIAGSVESLDQIDLRALEICHDLFYQPANMQLYISGDVDVEATIGQIDAWFGRRQWPPRAALHRLEPAGAPGASAVAEPIRLSIAQPHLQVCFKDRIGRRQGKELLRRELAAELGLDLLFGSSNRFFETNYSKGLIDGESFDFETYAEPSFRFCFIGGDTPEPQVLTDLILEQITRGRQKGWSGADWQRSQRKSFGHLVQQLDSVEGCAELMHSAVSRGAAPGDLFDIYREVSQEDVAKVWAEWVDPAAAVVSVVLPSE